MFEVHSGSLADDRVRLLSKCIGSAECSVGTCRERHG